MPRTRDSVRGCAASSVKVDFMPRCRKSLLVSLAFMLLVPPAVLAQSAPPTASDPFTPTLEFQVLLNEFVALERAPVRATREEYKAWRDRTAPLLDQLVTKLQALASRAQDSPDVLLVLALAYARRAGFYLDERREIDAEYNRRVLTTTAEEVAAADPTLIQRRADAAAKVAQEYEQIESTLRAALERADALRESQQMSLVQGVILAQSAIVLDVSIDAQQAAGREVEWEPGVIRNLLDEAEGLLKAYLERTPQSSGLAWVRGQFYLGVVQYRRALLPRVKDKVYSTEVDPARADVYAEARRIFKDLSDPAAVLAILRPEPDPERKRQTAAGKSFESSSFFLNSNYSEEAVANYYASTANLYLGLIEAIDPAHVADPKGRLTAAKVYLDRAKALDSFVLDPGQPAVSLTQETIPRGADKVTGELERATTVAERKPLHDLTFTFGAGILYDSNVTLLGRNTYAPVTKDRKRDFRAMSSFQIDYVADLDAYAPGNAFLKRWQVFLEGRANSTWNARIHDFNEQYYGATANVRYEIVGPGAVEQLDGVYAHVRYDYDQIMLGNNGFLAYNRLRPMLQVVAFERFLDTQVFFSYERRNYQEDLFDERFDRDGDYFSGGVNAQLDFGRWVDADKLWGEWAWGGLAPHKTDPAWRRPLLFSSGIEFTSNSTDGDEFDYSSAILNAGVIVPFPVGIDFVVAGVWEWQDYWQNSLIDRNRRPREDFIQEYRFRAERKFFLTQNYKDDFEYSMPLNLTRLVMTVYGDIRFTIDDSNVRDRLGQSVFEYNRIQYGAGVRFDLN